MAKKFRTKSFTRGKLLKMRGGFQPAMPRRPVAPSLPKDVKEFTDKATNGKPSRARRFLDEISSSNFNIHINPRVSVKLGAQPGDGAIGSKTRTTVEEEESTRKISGENNVVEGRRHTWNVKAGQETSKWIKDTAKLNGSTVTTVYDTQVNMNMGNPDRKLLTKYGGFNEKRQHLLRPVLFGFTPWEMKNWLNVEWESATNTNEYRQSQHKEQTGYLSVMNFQSHLTVINRNAFLPVRIKASLIALDLRADPLDLMIQSANSTIVTQETNKMPVMLQQTAPSSNSLICSISVDPLSQGIKGANAFKDLAKIVTTKSFKLCAGDELVIKYKHECGPGLNVGKMSELLNESQLTTSNTAAECMITYGLLLEQYGVSCECIKNSDTSVVMNGTSSSGIHIESRKKVELACNASNPFTSINTVGDRGWLSDYAAMKIFTKNPLRHSGNRRTHIAPEDIGTSSTQFSIPLVTSSKTDIAQSLI
jgi:hypothetical protein